jgi:hypothetical protein
MIREAQRIILILRRVSRKENSYTLLGNLVLRHLLSGVALDRAGAEKRLTRFSDSYDPSQFPSLLYLGFTPTNFTDVFLPGPYLFFTRLPSETGLLLR